MSASGDVVKHERKAVPAAVRASRSGASFAWCDRPETKVMSSATRSASPRSRRRRAGTGRTAYVARTTLGGRALPTFMHAAAVDRFGGPKELTLHTLTVPRPGPNEVLIALRAAGVGIWDAKERSGQWAWSAKQFPCVLGAEGAGRVVAIGARVARFAVGDDVYAYSYDNAKGGFYAEYAAVPAGSVARVPDSLDPLRAGGVPVIGLTALQGVDDALHIRRGETLIVYGASGNVGMLAVQFARLRGARVLAVASGRDGVAFVRRLGADHVIDGRRDDVTAAARSFAPGGVDAGLAFAGGPGLTRCLAAIRRGGRLAYPRGIEPEPRKRRGLTIRRYDGESGPGHFARLARALEDGHIEIPIAAVYHLADAGRAHAQIERGHVLGKIVLRIGAHK